MELVFFVDSMDEATLRRKRMVADVVRADVHAPRYHFVAPEGTCYPFDPNGAVYWKGRFHLFYIFQDPDLPRGAHCWGHASSADLVQWTYHPTALAPAEGDPGWGVYNVFDPHVWLEGDTYYAILGGMVKPFDLRDTAYLFTSKDLIHWRYERPFYNPHPHWTEENEDCACPDFFKLGDRHVLLSISHAYGTRYYLGRLDDGTFVAEEHHRMNWPGGPCFAPETLLDDKGRRIFWAWAFDQRREGPEGTPARETGVMTLPRILSLDENGAMKIEPPGELDVLRGRHRRRDNLRIDPGNELRLEEFDGDCLELAVEVDVPDPGRFGLVVGLSPEGSERTVIVCDTENGTLEVDATSSSLSTEVRRLSPFARKRGEQRDCPIQTAPFVLAANEKLRLRIFLDKSMLEAFANDRQCITQRIYPTRDNSLGVAVFSEGGAALVRSIDAWDMASPNTDCV
jgi:sucrose-6-phosphate hydrolase SacC (GH32 family)